MSDLLPSNATALERALSEAGAAAFDLPVDFQAVLDPARTGEAFVPFLAWGNSTDLWDRDWSIERKRAVAKAWFRLHRLKGTLTGIEEAVRFFDAKVISARRPPDGFYPGRGQNKAEREAYLAKFRQVRIYPFRSRGVAHGAFLGAPGRTPSLFLTRFFPVTTDAAARRGRRAFVYDPLTGVEEPVTRLVRTTDSEERTALEFEQVVLPGRSGRAFFVGRALSPGRVFLTSRGAGRRIYSMAVDQTFVETTTSLQLSSVLPSVSPISVRPRRVALQGERVKGQLFPGAPGTRRGFLTGIYLPRSSAYLRRYDQIFLHDRDRLPDRRRMGRAFAGNVRLGMPPYRARLAIEVRGKRPSNAFGKFVRGFLHSSDQTRRSQAIEATRQSKALRDKVLVSTTTLRTIRVSDGAKVGTTKVGALVRDV